MATLRLISVDFSAKREDIEVTVTGLVTLHKHRLTSFCKPWHCAEPRGKLGPETKIWEGRHKIDMALFLRVNTEHDSRAN